MPREILIHLNVEAPDSDSRTANEIADAILGTLDSRTDYDCLDRLVIVAPLAEEV